MKTENWYKTWFNSPYYHMLYRRRDHEEAAAFIDHFLKYLNPPSTDKILDLGCGKGRHSIYMNRKGYDVTGIDISEQNIAYAEAFENDTLRFAIHDMREPFDPGRFDLAVNLFTSFGYFDSMDENLRVLRATNANLKHKGRVLIDYLNAELLRNTLVESETQRINNVVFNIERSIENEMIIKKIEIIDGPDTFRFEERVKALDKQDFAGLLAQSGFELLDVFGTYSLTRFIPETSPRLIIIARKFK